MQHKSFTSPQGLNLTYSETDGAKGAKTLLIHGFSGSRYKDWIDTGWMDLLEKAGRHAVAIDNPGHGDSDKPQDIACYSLEQMAANAAALMDHLGWDKADVVGYSMGGMIAMTFAWSQHDRLNKLVVGGVGEKALQPSLIPEFLINEMRRDDLENSPMAQMLTMWRDDGQDLLAMACCGEGISGGADGKKIAAVDVDAIAVAGGADNLAVNPQAVADVLKAKKLAVLDGVDHVACIPHQDFKAETFAHWGEAMPN